MESTSREYGPFFYTLSRPECLAAVRFIDEFAQLYPKAAALATAGRGNEEAVYVYITFPPDEDESIEMSEKAAELTIQILLYTGVSIVVMPSDDAA